MCESCSPKRRRKPAPAAEVVTLRPVVEAGLLATTRAELERADRTDTVAGQTALLLAMQMEQGTHSGAGFAQLAKGLREAMAEALRGAAVADDPVDELRDRMARKLSGA